MTSIRVACLSCKLMIDAPKVRRQFKAKMTSDQLKTMAVASPTIRYSVPLNPESYVGDEYFCRFKPRVHRDVGLADAGSWQCQVDFLGSSAAARADSSRNKSNVSYAVGCIDPVVGNFTALCACEAIPGRLALTTYIVEYAYIHDDGKRLSCNSSALNNKTNGFSDRICRRQKRESCE